MSRFLPLAAAALSILGLSALGCSVDAQQGPVDSHVEKSYALIAVERSTIVNGHEAPRAQAVVGFARLQPGQQASARSLGALGTAMPELNQCVHFPRAEQARGALEFVDAGDVVIDVAGARRSLAPRALPTVADLISGVIYTSRDQDELLLPADRQYSVRALGGQFSGFEATGSAPKLLGGINVGGQALESVAHVSASAPLDVSWEEGDPNDTVLVELAGAEGGVVCAFRDDLGAGTVAAHATTRGAGRLSLHRIRTLPLARQAGELSFDFQVTLPIEIRE
ncbi:MAG: hypothetical protein SFV15_18465 [Polyangiaceae bacterium]|nr:hypothetical protein [Polyangiaceae bacterium]